MKTYSVLVPMAGHILVEVKAENEKEAIAAALQSDDLILDNLQDWDVLRRFNQGNVCYCPHPWEAEAELIADD